MVTETLAAAEYFTTSYLFAQYYYFYSITLCIKF